MSKRAEAAARKIFKPIDKAVVNLLAKQELIDYQNLRMEQKRQYIAGYEQAEKDIIDLAQLWVDSGDANVMSFEQFLKRKLENGYETV